MIFATQSAKHLVRGLRLASYDSGNFADGELWVKIRKKVQGTALVIGNTGPAAEDFLEFILLAGAARQAGAKKIIGVVPYLGYGRQDHASFKREVPLFKFVSRLLATALDELVVIDPHPPYIEKFFKIPVRVLRPYDEFAGKIWRAKNGVQTVLAPDGAARERAQIFAKLLRAPRTAWIEKVRPRPGVAHARRLHGELVGRVLIVDDMIDSGGTVLEALKFVRRAGALPGSFGKHGGLHVVVAATHGIRMTRELLNKLRRAGASNVYIANSLPQPKGVHIISLAQTLARIVKE